jgi:hypothetical protein
LNIGVDADMEWRVFKTANEMSRRWCDGDSGGDGGEKGGEGWRWRCAGGGVKTGARMVVFTVPTRDFLFFFKMRPLNNIWPAI